MNEPKVLEVVESIEFRYSEDDRVTYAVPAGLVLHRGETWCIRGVSGSGKSTLMTLLAALRRFCQGLICYSFRDGLPRYVSAKIWQQAVGPDLWRRIGFAFQRPELIRSLNVRDNLSLVLDNSARHAAALFDDQEWQSIADSRVWKVSGGQVQRLGLLRAFGEQQDLVFLDEPTNNLDCTNRDAVASFVRDQRCDRALVVVSHDEEFIETLEIDCVFNIEQQMSGDGSIHRSLVAERPPKKRSPINPKSQQDAVEPIVPNCRRVGMENQV